MGLFDDVSDIDAGVEAVSPPPSIEVQGVVERVTYEPTYERPAASTPTDYSTQYPLD